MWIAWTAYEGLAQKDVPTNLDENAVDPNTGPRDLYSAFLSARPIASNGVYTHVRRERVAQAAGDFDPLRGVSL